MVDKSKLNAALHALNGILVRARTMAYEGVDHMKLADVLDRAEELPMLMARDDDMTLAFKQALQDLASTHEGFEFIVQRFNE